MHSDRFLLLAAGSKTIARAHYIRIDSSQHGLVVEATPITPHHRLVPVDDML